jgi:hypothetical protein
VIVCGQLQRRGSYGTGNTSKPEEDHLESEIDCGKSGEDHPQSAGDRKEPEEDHLESGQDSQEDIARVAKVLFSPDATRAE